MMTTAYLFALIDPITGRILHLTVMTDPHYSGACGLGDPVAAIILQAEGPDFESAFAALGEVVRRMPNIQSLWDKFGVRPW